MLRPADPDGMRAAWSALEDVVGDRRSSLARGAPRSGSCTSPSTASGRSSQTLRHLVFAMDKWFTPADPRRTRLPPDRVAELRLGRLPAGRASTATLTPSFDEALAVRADRARAASATTSQSLTPGRSRHATVDVLENGTTPGARVPLHRVRGGVLAQPLRPARPRRYCRPPAAEPGLRPRAGEPAHRGTAASRCSFGQV